MAGQAEIPQMPGPVWAAITDVILVILNLTLPQVSDIVYFTLRQEVTF
jgi:hypothetical protein